MNEQKCTCQKVPKLNYVSSDPDCPVHYPKIDKEQKWTEEFEEYFEDEMYILQFSTVPPKTDIFEIVKGWMKDTWLESRRRLKDEM